MTAMFKREKVLLSVTPTIYKLYWDSDADLAVAIY